MRLADAQTGRPYGNHFPIWMKSHPEESYLSFGFTLSSTVFIHCRDARSGRPPAAWVRAGEFPIRTISIRAADAQTGRPYSNHFHYNWMGRNPKL
jgi:hypothetical protein